MYLFSQEKGERKRARTHGVAVARRRGGQLKIGQVSGPASRMQLRGADSGCSGAARRGAAQWRGAAPKDPGPMR